MKPKYILIFPLTFLLLSCNKKEADQKVALNQRTILASGVMGFRKGLRKEQIDTSVFVYFDETKCRFLKQNIPNEAHIYECNILITRLIPSMPDSFYIRYSEGLSGDPWFGVFRKEKDTVVFLGGSDGLELTILNNNKILVSGHTDNYFDTRKLFVVSRDTLLEVPQPFYYVGLQSRTSKDLILFSDTTETQTIMSLPKGTRVEVLLNKQDYYLLKTEMDIVGWVKVGYDDFLDGIYFAGD